MPKLWIRKVGLIVSQGMTPGSKVLDLSELKIYFHVS